MYDIQWFATMAGIIALFVETIKRSGGHWVRDANPTVAKYYPVAIKGIVFLAALVICFVAEADAFLTLEIEGVEPMAGYVFGAVLMVGGETLIDALWDKRKPLAEFVDLFLKGKINAPTA